MQANRQSMNHSIKQVSKRTTSQAINQFKQAAQSTNQASKQPLYQSTNQSIK